MLKKVDIRAARPTDALAIHFILQEVWDASLLFDGFADNILAPDHHVLIALEAGEVVGFLSAFLVPSQNPRWEIDLIAVRSRSRGKGIGPSLIEAALTYGSHLGASWAQALIRMDNYASQRAFSKAGWTTDAQVGSIFLWHPLACKSVPNVPPPVHLIPVNTLIYRGLWIEGFFESQLPLKAQRNVIRAARHAIFHQARLNTGMFVPDRLKQTIAPDLLAAGTCYGQYCQWRHTLK